jgi:peptidyl-prolyl cis-trans isomerase D
MLNVMRENLRHLKWVLWVVALAMTLSLGYYFVDRPADNAAWAVMVNETPISGQEYVQTLKRQSERYREIFGDQYDMVRGQLAQQVLQELISREIMRQEAKKLGLSASPEEVSRAILEDPSLQNPDGSFIGRDRYVRILQRYPGGAAAYEQLIADEIAIGQWRALVTSPANVADDDVRELYSDRFDRTEVDFVVVTSAAQADKVSQKVSDDELREWYETHQDRYMRDEGRRIRFFVVERQAQVASVEVTDEEIEAFYNSRLDQFDRPEQRRARHILVRVAPDATEDERAQARQKADDLLGRLQAGEPFETLAQAESDDTGSGSRGGDLGFFGRGAMVPEFDAAAFDTPVGSFAPVVQTQFGFHVIQVTDERTAGRVPLAEVRESIRRQIQQQRAEDAMRSESNRLYGQIAAGVDLDVVAEAEGLTVQERVVTRSDRMADLGPSPEFTSAVFSLEPGGVSEPVGLRQGNAVLTVTEIIPESVSPLEDVLGQVTADLLNDRALVAARDAARKAFDRHGTVEAAAKSLGLTVQSSGELAPSQPLSGSGGSSPELDEALFGAQARAGDKGVGPVPAGAVIYEVTRRDGFDPAKYAEFEGGLRRELLQLRQGELLQSVLDRVRDGYDIRINTELVSQFSGV